LERKRVDVYHHSSKESKVVLKRCAWCKGKGYVDNEITGSLSRKTCDVCGGAGQNKFSGTVVRCARCKGTGIKGRKTFNAPVKCDVCGGKGLKEI